MDQGCAVADPGLWSSCSIWTVASSEYKTELEEVIKDETSGDFTKALLAMLSAKKDEGEKVDLELAQKDAKVKAAGSF